MPHDRMHRLLVVIGGFDSIWLLNPVEQPILAKKKNFCWEENFQMWKIKDTTANL